MHTKQTMSFKTVIGFSYTPAFSTTNSGSKAELETQATMFWSFQISQKISPVTYRRILPPESHIHLVFHISLFKKYQGPLHPEIKNSTAKITEHKKIFSPEVIIETLTIHDGNNSINQVLSSVMDQYHKIQLERISQTSRSWSQLKTGGMIRIQN